MRNIKQYVEIVGQDGKNVTLNFSADYGAFGTNEGVDEITIEIDKLLFILQSLERDEQE